MLKLLPAALALCVLLHGASAQASGTPPSRSNIDQGTTLTEITRERMTSAGLLPLPPRPSPDKRPRMRPPRFLEETVLPSLPRRMPLNDDLTCLALVIYHEARGEIIEGQRAVASVILQRAVTPGRWGNSVCEAAQPGQFSFVSKDRSTPPIEEIEAWQHAVRLARRMSASGPLPRFQGADHYHTISISPSWTRSMKRTQRIGRHVFFADPASRT